MHGGTYDPTLYCKVFIDTDASVEGLVALIARSVGGVVESRTIITAHSEVDVRHNDDHRFASAESRGDFLFYPYYLDVVPTSQANRYTQVQLVTELLETLWQGGLAAVAACDFEDELPHHGGLDTQGARH